MINRQIPAFSGISNELMTSLSNMRANKTIVLNAGISVCDITTDTVVKSKYHKKQQTIEITKPSSYVVIH